MAPFASTLHQFAVLGGRPAFPPGDPVPLIHAQGYRPKGDFTAVDAIHANEPNDGSTPRASRQRFIAKILPGVEGPGPSFRITLQHRIGTFLNLDANKTSVICVSSGTNALRVVLKGVREVISNTNCNEVIVPQTTVGATIEAVIDEGFVPVFVGVDPKTWLLSPELVERSISGKTAAIITVDWLGTQCDLGPFRKLADKHDIKLISDSAQSFGATNGKPPSVDLAHATIYSFGYPKVLTGAGSGGLIVCPRALADLLESDPTGILRHEALSETNAFMCLQALGSLPETLATRRAAGDLYCQLLADIPGITFQQIPDGLGTNHYQVTFTVDAETFGLDAKRVCRALRAENVHCSADRMPCVAANEKFAAHGKVGGDLEHSRLLAATSVTLPISNLISLDTVKTICGLVKLIQERARDILEAKQAERAATPPSNSADVIDIESKFRQHLVVPILDNASVHSKVLIPRDYLAENDISIDEFLERFVSRQQWSLNEPVIKDLRVNAIIGSATVVILAQHNVGQSSNTGNPKAVPLDESGSSASVTLVPRADGSLIVRKWANGHGIDGNGAPWLRRQSLFLNASQAVKKTGMFVTPTKVNDSGKDVTLELPYIASHSFGELVFANAGAEPVVNALVAMLARMATSVWTEGQEEANPDFIEQAHFERMKRRLKIARAQDETLDRILKQETVMLNGRLLDGFDTVMEKLEGHPMLANIEPTILTEIHGDLNIHNILSRLDHNDKEDVALIDPRGVPLLGDDSRKTFERGGYCYDVSKLLFSLTGFSEIGKRRFEYSSDGDSHVLRILQHPGSDTMNGAAARLIPALASNKEMKEWIDKVERHGVRSFWPRVMVGEAAHFVADCACALGRDTPWEIVPLFLLGLEKLNDAVALLDGSVHLSTYKREVSFNFPPMPESPDFGAATIQATLFESQISNKAWPYDVLEFSVKAESCSILQKQFREMVGTYFPRGTGVYLSTDPVKSVKPSPCVLIHPSNGVRGQTHMLAAAARRTTAFFRDNGVSQSIIDNLEIVHISSTGSSSRSQFTARANDKLLSPGSFGISPLQLAVLQANQLPFPKPGRWVVENDSFFLLSRPLSMGGNELCLLAMERPASGSSSSWRVCIDETEQRNGRLLAKSFRDIAVHEQGKKLMRTTTGLFIPHRLAKAISMKEDDYAARASPLLIDVVLPRFMDHDDWIRLSHQQGYGVASHRVWENAQSFQRVANVVELADGGDKMAFYHYGSDKEYNKLLKGVREDPRLNSLAYAGAAVHWLHRLESKGLVASGEAE